MGDLRPDLGIIFGHALGASAVVTPPGGSGIPATVVIHPPRFAEFIPGAPQAVQDPIREVSLRRDQIATLRSGTTIAVTEGPEAGKTYTVDAVADEDPQVFRAVVR